MSEFDALAAVEAAKEAAAARAREDAVRVAAAYKRVFSSPDGQIVFSDLRRRFVDCPIARPTHGPEFAFFREGRRSAVAFIFQMTEGDFDGSNRADD